MSRLVRVELRKMADTRAGMWLLIGIAGLAAIVMGIFMATADSADRTFVRLVGVAVVPQSALVPVLGILLVTSEWTQRTALVTLTLEPVRRRVVAAKVAAALVFGLAAVFVTLLIAAAVTAVGGNEVAWSDAGAGTIANLTLVQESMILQGLAFGLVILNSAGAIATFFVLPTAVGLITMLWDAIEDLAPWINFDSGALLEGRTLRAEEWAQFGVTSLIWIALPLGAGLVRVLRKEVK
ncbi:MAG: ABC transporter permease [Actinomycetota bacterium]|nr:ABC transporter permease [Actinomycetota bacterium]